MYIAQYPASNIENPAFKFISLSVSMASRPEIIAAECNPRFEGIR
jgi:hypothetical protein